MDRSRITRWAAPVAFLALITIGALVVRAGLEHGKHKVGRPTTTLVGKTTSSKGHGHKLKKHVRRYTTVQSGDTLASIAAKTGTTVARLMQLNPGVDPAALRIGQRIRVQ